MLGFGSLVNEISASKSFALSNFRQGTVRGFRRVFSRADWINIDWGDARTCTGEVCSVALAPCRRGYDGDAETEIRVALMEVSETEGIAGFLDREATYEIIQVPYLDDEGRHGVALACGECTEEDLRRLWPEASCWYLQNCRGKISYACAQPESVEPGIGHDDDMPLVAEVQREAGGALIPGDPAVWLPLTPPRGKRPFNLPDRRWVYPSPGYLRLVYRAHAKAGLAENFLDTTFLMDRHTNIRSYLAANPLLLAWVTDPKHHPDRACDRYG